MDRTSCTIILESCLLTSRFSPSETSLDFDAGGGEDTGGRGLLRIWELKMGRKRLSEMQNPGNHFISSKGAVTVLELFRGESNHINEYGTVRLHSEEPDL